MNRDINALTPDTAAKCRAALLAWEAAGLRVFVTETLRTSQRQAELWAIGRTKPGRKVTGAPPGTSKHEFGLAFDVAFIGANQYPEDTQLWARLGSIGESVGLFWGGRFRSVDSPHFQTVKDKTMIDEKTKAAASASVAGLAVPALKSAKAATVMKMLVPVVLVALPTIATFVPQIAPFIGAINALAGFFGYGA